MHSEIMIGEKRKEEEREGERGEKGREREGREGGRASERKGGKRKRK